MKNLIELSKTFKVTLTFDTKDTKQTCLIIFTPKVETEGVEIDLTPLYVESDTNVFEEIKKAIDGLYEPNKSNLDAINSLSKMIVKAKKDLEEKATIKKTVKKKVEAIKEKPANDLFAVKEPIKKPAVADKVIVATVTGSSVPKETVEKVKEQVKEVLEQPNISGLKIPDPIEKIEDFILRTPIENTAKMIYDEQEAHSERFIQQEEELPDWAINMQDSSFR